jgi:hypothetical protein
MQITGPHFLDGHRHPWLHRADNDNPESAPRESQKHQTISLFKYPESARGGASRMARSKAECHRRRTRHHCVTADPGGTMMMVVFFAGGGGLQTEAMCHPVVVIPTSP